MDLINYLSSKSSILLNFCFLSLLITKFWDFSLSKTGGILNFYILECMYVYLYFLKFTESTYDCMKNKLVNKYIYI